MAWRKPNEGLSYTNKGKKDSDGGRMAHFFVTVTFNEGIKYHEKIESFMKIHFSMKLIKKPLSNLFKE